MTWPEAAVKITEYVFGLVAMLGFMYFIYRMGDHYK